MKIWLMTAALSGLLWLSIGAATGHHEMEHQAAVWMEKAQRYHIVHTLALLWLAGFGVQFAGVSATAWLWLIGTVLFSGSLYVMSLSSYHNLRFIVPIGGMALAGGWAWLAFIIFRTKL